MTAVDTGLDSDLIAGLDFKPGCEGDGCGQDATHQIISIDGCACFVLVCALHLYQTVLQLSKIGDFQCTKCGHEVDGVWGMDLVRIEAL